MRSKLKGVLTSMANALPDYRECWERKPVLRTIYGDFYDRIVSACVSGRTLEIGGGIGNLKERFPDVLTTDIQSAPWLDCVADAQRLPFAAGSFSNIVMVDVLHHVEFPTMFFREAGRILRPRGRVVMVEPAITWGSSGFYKFLHREPVNMRADPLIEGMPDATRDPYDANQAVPTLIATRYKLRFAKRFPELSIVRVDWFSFLTYPLSGGFRRWRLLSEAAARRLLSVERAIEPVVGRLAGFRVMLVIERRK